MSSCHRGVYNKAVNTSCSYWQKATNLINKQQLSKSHFLVKKSYGGSLAIRAVWHRSLMALWLKQDWGASIMKIMTCHISYLTNSRKLHIYLIRKGRHIQSKFASARNSLPLLSCRHNMTMSWVHKNPKSYILLFVCLVWRGIFLLVTFFFCKS